MVQPSQYCDSIMKLCSDMLHDGTADGTAITISVTVMKLCSDMLHDGTADGTAITISVTV